MARPYKRKGSRFYWISPWIQGRQVPQSTGTVEFDKAERQLKILEGKLAANAPISAKTDREAFNTLLTLVRTDYKIKRRDTLSDLERRIDKHLAPFMGAMPCGKVTSSLINQYILNRQRLGAANASINRELAIIKRAFTLGMRSGEVSHAPHIEFLPESNVCSGFFTVDAFREVIAKANPLLRDVLLVCYYTGWRIDSVLKLEWRNVDLERNLLSLRAQQTKNLKATAFPLILFPELKGVFERRQALTREIELRDECTIASVFHRNGQSVLSIRTAWQKTRKRALLPNRKIHDLRRTAVRNLETLGFSETSIMNMVGLKTRSMFLRYNITTEEDILMKAQVIVEKQKAMNA